MPAVIATLVGVLLIWALLHRSDAIDPVANGKRLSAHLLLSFGPVRNEQEMALSREQ